MKRRTLGIVAVVALLIIAAIGGGLWAFGRLSFLDSYGSQYDYSVRISADEPISNVTILVPLPVDNDTSPIGDTIESREYLVPETWSYDVMETQYGPMLRIRADEIPAEPTYYRAIVKNDRLVRWEQIPESEYSRNDSGTLRVEHDMVDLNADATVNRSIDTQSPQGAEPLFQPRSDSRAVPCEWPHEDDKTRCYSYDTMLFLQYDGPETTNVSVSVELTGTNSWWVGGWNYNEYTDRIRAYDIPADRQGWVVVDGELQTSVGNYPRNPPQ